MRRARGQAALETALTLPLVVFMFLGTLQLFVVLQARILAQYAVSRATRHGALNFGDCLSMADAATLVLVPALDASFARTPAKGAAYAAAVSEHLDDARSGRLLWLDRLQPDPARLDRALEEEVWDLPPHHTFEVRMVFWAPLAIPFAGPLFARVALAHWGVRELHDADPLMPVKRDAQWVQGSAGPQRSISEELERRYDAQEYAFPIVVTHATRMMSPARFRDAACPR